MAKAKLVHVLRITYSMEHYPKMDELLEKKLKKQISDSGSGLGERDVSFFFPNVLAAMRALRKTRSMTKLRSAVAEIYYHI